MLVCPKCGYKGKKGAEFCRKCGAHLLKKPNVCPKCGNAVKKDATFCRKCGANIGKAYRPKKKVPVVPLLIGGAVGAAILVMMVLVFLVAAIVVLAGGLQTPTNMTAEVAQVSCGNSFSYTVQITDAEGQGMENQQISTYVDDELYERAKTDQNGMFSSSTKVPSDWCGERIEFRVDYTGDIMHGPVSTDMTMPVKIPTTLWINAPVTAVNNTETYITVVLQNAINNKPIQGKTVVVVDNTIDGIYSEGVTDSDGTANVTVIFDWIGTRYISAFFEGGDTYLGVETESLAVEVVPESCDQYTYVGECSDEYPGYYCAPGREWIADCITCSCGSDRVCYNNTCMTEDERKGWLIIDLQKSMVYIEHSYATGSGVVIGHEDGDTVILTNRHVVEDASSVYDLTITTNEQQTVSAFEIFIAPSEMDLAIVKVHGTYGTVATFGYSYWQGQDVMALGSPLGLQGSVSEGIISNVYYFYTDTNYQHTVIQTDAAINPGNSGGGLFLMSTGELIGINSFVYLSKHGAEGLGFAIDIEEYENLGDYEYWTAFTPTPRCSDGTAYGYCSSSYIGQYCSNGYLINKCTTCGCSEDYTCFPDEKCYTCDPGYEIHIDNNDDPYCCKTGWTGWSDGDGDGFCCRPGYSAWVDEDDDGFCCPPGYSGYTDGTCG